MSMFSSTSKAAPLERVAANAPNAAVAAWLWFTAGLVFAMIIVGGATRLTDSGLSITEWQPLLGALPPLNDADWHVAFEKYRQIPQYHIVNKGMSLEAFKAIYWWEWAHRFLGRIIGIVFAVPLFVFWRMGRLHRAAATKYVGVFLLGGLQGVIGWYMVKSGLAERVDVSQYRLALHLTTAFAILGLLVWLALDASGVGTNGNRGSVTPAIKRTASALVVLVMFQVVLGAFVAGLNAGLVYNTWPTMDSYWVPPDYWATTPAYLSFFEGHAATQFNHRLLAYIVGVMALFQAYQVMRAPVAVDGAVWRSAFVVVIAVALQMMLGIMTLLAQVPLSLGLLHQGGGALVLAAAVWHLHAARAARNIARA